MVHRSGPYIPMTAKRGLRVGSAWSSSWNKKLISRQATDALLRPGDVDDAIAVAFPVAVAVAVALAVTVVDADDPVVKRDWAVILTRASRLAQCMVSSSFGRNDSPRHGPSDKNMNDISILNGNCDGNWPFMLVSSKQQAASNNEIKRRCGFGAPMVLKK